MLYTIRPLERIYATPETFAPIYKSQAKASDPYAQAEYRELPLQNGRLVARRDGENYIIQKINSTSMQDYLNDEYFPGKSIKNKF